MTCLGSSGTGTPQAKVVRLIERSRSPRLTKAIFLRRDEIGVGLVMGDQLVGVGGELEEIALLLDPADRRAGRGELGPVGAGSQLGFLEIGFVAHRVPAGIFA
jgi:hypothetical protein